MDFAFAEAVVKLRRSVRRIDRKLDDALALLDQLGEQMTTQAEAIQGLAVKVDGLTTLTTDILADFNALLTAMNTERENLTAAGQAALDAANASTDAAQAKLTELDVAVGDADGSDVPVPPPAP